VGGDWGLGEGASVSPHTTTELKGILTVLKLCALYMAHYYIDFEA